MLCGIICPRCTGPRASFADDPEPHYAEPLLRAESVPQHKPAYSLSAAEEQAGKRKHLKTQGGAGGYARCGHCSAAFSPLFSEIKSSSLCTDVTKERQEEEKGQWLESQNNADNHAAVPCPNCFFAPSLGSNEPAEGLYLGRASVEPSGRCSGSLPVALPHSVDSLSNENSTYFFDTLSIFSEEGPLCQADATRSTLSGELSFFARANANAEAETAAATPEAGRKTLDYVVSPVRENAGGLKASYGRLSSRADNANCILRRGSSSEGVRFSLASRSHCSTFASCLSSSPPPAPGRFPEDSSPLFFAALRGNSNPDQQRHPEQCPPKLNAPFGNVAADIFPFAPAEYAWASASTAANSVSVELSHPCRALHIGTSELQYTGDLIEGLCGTMPKEVSFDGNGTRSETRYLTESSSVLLQNILKGSERSVHPENTVDFSSKSRKQTTQSDSPNGGLHSLTLCDAPASAPARSKDILKAADLLPLPAGDEDAPLVAPDSPAVAASFVNILFGVRTSASTRNVALRDRVSQDQLLQCDDQHKSASESPSSQHSPARRREKENHFHAHVSAAQVKLCRHIPCTEGFQSHVQSKSGQVREENSTHTVRSQDAPSDACDVIDLCDIACSAATDELSNSLNSAQNETSSADTRTPIFVRLMKQKQQSAAAVGCAEDCISPIRGDDDSSLEDALSEGVLSISVPRASHAVTVQQECIMIQPEQEDLCGSISVPLRSNYHRSRLGEPSLPS